MPEHATREGALPSQLAACLQSRTLSVPAIRLGFGNERPPRNITPGLEAA
jgi:hypothetical protein